MITRLIVETPSASAETLEMAARLERNGRQIRLWWRVPAEWQEALTTWADPFVVGMLFPLMQLGGEAEVEGRVSPSLLRNLETLGSIWHAWYPDRYQPVKIKGREEVEMPTGLGRERRIVPFSTGVDSCYTLWRHHRRLMGRRNLEIGAALVMHGFDIWLDQPHATEIYAGLLRGARAMLASVQVPCIPVTSNFHELPTIWADSFGTHLVSGLMLFAQGFGGTAIPNNIPYRQLGPWGSTPASDPFLGSAAFAVTDDGGESTRFEKIALLREWPEAMAHLRVCFTNPVSHANCCVCEKCIRTILAFRISGAARPGTFARDVTPRQIRRVKFNYPMNNDLWGELVAGLHAQGLEKTDWGRAILAAAKPHPVQTLKGAFIPLRNQVRRLFRGTTMSRKEMQAARPDQEEVFVAPWIVKGKVRGK